MSQDRPPRVAVIGGGPGGLAAAEVLATAGCSVTVFEHMPSVGRKFLLAGRSGLNITHSEDVERLLDRYGAARSLLESAVRRYTPADLRVWCAELGDPTFVGSSGRVFPTSFRATPLLRAWLRRLAELDVQIEVKHRWTGWDKHPDGTNDNRSLQFFAPEPHHLGTTVERLVKADAVIFALGGASWPRVGSDGRWTEAFAEAGVKVNELRSANCGIRFDWPSSFTSRFAGEPLKNVAITVDGSTVRGDAMITDRGLEGSPVYTHSSAIRDAIDATGRCPIDIDLQPDLTVERVADRLRRQRAKDSISTTLRKALHLSPASVAILRLAAPDISREPDALAVALKRATLVTESMEPLARAISTAGGIALDEIDEAFMLRSMPGTFIAGEMLDWEAPTGGYLLQATFSTARRAAEGALAWLQRHPSP